ncbi:expressed unknown protein [Seminavis robusta]|uniref:Uncharacterized protein n=1 Tax=Seminavis robusta TaxID=568900 RepID=A0A9N8HXE3_9STRA|nr:expressed unknown protein [Seminavis robusta]|eukprot:Sro1795_g298040.1 n/a (204) ;mRNA; r:12886-13610
MVQSPLVSKTTSARSVPIMFSASSTPAEGFNEEPAEDSITAQEKKTTGIRQRLSSYFKGSDADDGLTFRQRLAKMGLATVLSYGWVSNVNSMVLVAASWYVFGARTGMSPLYPGQWKNFLTVYGGFYVLSNFLRPFRFTAAVAIGPYFERFVNWIQRKTGLPKAGAVTATVMLVNFGGTILLMVGGISLASLFSGVPIFPPKA